MVNDIGVDPLTVSSEQESSSSSTSVSTVPLQSIAEATSAEERTLVSCMICKKKNVELKVMRTHVGKHLINSSDICENSCGFCGMVGCKTYLETSSSSGSKTFHQPKSNCPYFYPYKRLGKKATRYTPCLNRVTSCPVCNMNIWSYNLKEHFSQKHPDEDNSVVCVPKEEIILLNKFKE